MQILVQEEAPWLELRIFVHLLRAIDTSSYSILHTLSPFLPSLLLSSLFLYHLPLPISNMCQNNLRRILRTMLSPNSLHKVPLRIHQIKINAMIDQIILSLLNPFWCREVHSILLTNILNLFPRAREAYDCGVELGEVCLQNARGIAGWVAGYEEREERRERG
jgi:hypothetical protein